MERRLALSRNEAQQLIGSGRVLVSGAIADKPSRLVARAEPVVIAEPKRFVSRGGEKLLAALDEFALDVKDKTCLDAGASTGGFTDCLLQNGAIRVWALDVGYGQLSPVLRGDPRVTVVERCNLRFATLHDLEAQPFEVLVADLAFISLTIVAQTLVLEMAALDAELVLLVKPQFEAGRHDVDRGKGVIRDPSIWREALVKVGNAFASQGAAIMGAMVSPVFGQAGNVEFLLHAKAPGPGATQTSADEIGSLADRAVVAATSIARKES